MDTVGRFPFSGLWTFFLSHWTYKLSQAINFKMADDGKGKNPVLVVFLAVFTEYLL